VRCARPSVQIDIGDSVQSRLAGDDLGPGEKVLCSDSRLDVRVIGALDEEAVKIAEIFIG
jgi:hypothetical protein